MSAKAMPRPFPRIRIILLQFAQGQNNSHFISPSVGDIPLILCRTFTGFRLFPRRELTLHGSRHETLNQLFLEDNEEDDHREYCQNEHGHYDGDVH
jgi:hypothetical protein